MPADPKKEWMIGELSSTRFFALEMKPNASARDRARVMALAKKIIEEERREAQAVEATQLEQGMLPAPQG
eukprot:CAMPEP_0179136522 /NCGR_PEP_ID=MMETSP0796-20121207/65063_1 /TAXON_ID=73915 /ORGANISM="Pyrodinium bahamense, Strain pbaha01" /LENGTH=69 /DNA_ID=CAMNT_0020835615 /DNA_START=116 /DNA_END=325 /DNA_ORIENTATION=+